MDDETKLTLHGLQQYYVKLKDNEKNRKLFDLLDVLEFNQVGGPQNRGHTHMDETPKSGGCWELLGSGWRRGRKKRRRKKKVLR